MGFHQEDLVDLTVELEALLNAWDPIGVADLVEDEYTATTGSVLAFLADDPTKADLCRFFYEVIAPDLSADPESADAFGAKVWAWFQAVKPPPISN